ncbi:MAG: oatA 2 [Phycisphaerales bacterium]|nr:oatA 2 [Phycisphaerales bacterium]
MSFAAPSTTASEVQQVAGQGPPRNWSAGHILVLDGLRGVAVLGVMFYHFLGVARPCTGWAASVQKAASWGWCGVDLFFVLSGFLITGILLDAKGSHNYFKTFYVRRVLRIFPLYYGVLAAVAVAMRIPAVSRFFGFEDIRASLWWMSAYLGSFVLTVRHDKNMFGPIGHFWSLAVEEHFYIVWPAIVWACTRRRLTVACLAFAAMALISRCVLVLKAGANEAPYMLTPCRVDGLALGALLALIVRSKLPVNLVRQWAWVLGAASAAALVGVGLKRGGFNHYGRTMNMAGFTLLAVAFTAAIALLISARPASRIRKALETPALLSVGRYSFAMYVLHQTCARPFKEYLFPADKLGGLLHSANLGILTYALLAAGATYLLALGSWHLYEKHFLRLKKLFPY